MNTINYGSGSNIRTAEKALTDLKSKLITAFEKKFGEFKELEEKPEQYDEQDTLRYLISNLEVKTENNRFYIVSFVHDFYIDKYTDEIYTHYKGLDESFSLFDPLSDSALAFPG